MSTSPTVKPSDPARRNTARPGVDQRFALVKTGRSRHPAVKMPFSLGRVSTTDLVAAPLDDLQAARFDARAGRSPGPPSRG